MSEIRLTADEKVQAANDIRDLILASDTTAEVYRPSVQGEDTFDGPYEQWPDTPYSVIYVEINEEPDAEVLEPDCDAVADTLPDYDVQKLDRIVCRGKRYRVWHVKHFYLFDVPTYKRLQLESDKVANAG